MINDYKNTEFQLYGHLIQLREIFKTNENVFDEINKINELIELIKNKKFNVAVMGEFKRGKSTLINAILGMNILPSDVTPATATINRITYGNEPAMTIYYHNGSVENADMKNIADYVTMLTDEGEKRAAHIKEAVIRYPTVICQNHVDIIDTPGLNDNAEMTKITIDMLNNIDAVIVVVSALSPFSEVETAFVSQLIKSDNVENIVFVVSYIDQIDEDEQDKLIEYMQKRITASVLEALRNENSSEELLGKTQRILDGSYIFGVSPYLALKSFVANDRKLLQRSRFERFKTELYEILTSQQGANMIHKTVKGIKKLSTGFDNSFNQKIIDLENEIRCIDENMDAFYKYQNDCIKILEDIFHSSEKNLKECLINILTLKPMFFNKFCNRWNQVSSNNWSEITIALSSEAHNCWVIANEQYAGIMKNQIFNMVSKAMTDFMEIRNKRLCIPLETINKISDFSITYADCYSRDIKEIMTSFGFPRFNWEISPIPNLQAPNIIKHFEHSVDISVQKMYEHWNIYINAAKKWWIGQVEAEASSIAMIIEEKTREIKDYKQSEIRLMKINMTKQKESVNEIINKTEQIYNDIFAL